MQEIVFGVLSVLIIIFAAVFGIWFEFGGREGYDEDSDDEKIDRVILDECKDDYEVLEDDIVNVDKSYYDNGNKGFYSYTMSAKVDVGTAEAMRKT